MSNFLKYPSTIKCEKSSSKEVEVHHNRIEQV